MRTLWAILLGGLAFIGTAEARLGETMEEIEKRVGALQIRDDKIFPEDCLNGVAEGQGGFDKIIFTFFKADSEKKCVNVQYIKYSETLEGLGFKFEDAKKLLEKNFSGTRPALDRSSTQGIRNGEQESDLWEASWELRTGAGATSSVYFAEGQMYVFSFACSDARFGEFMVKGYEKKDRAKEEKKSKAMDAL